MRISGKRFSFDQLLLSQTEEFRKFLLFLFFFFLIEIENRNPIFPFNILIIGNE